MFKFKKGDLIEVYTDLDDDGFTIGYVNDFNEEFVAINAINPRGLNDGIHVIRLDEIVKIEKETNYDKKLVTLMKWKNTVLSDYKFKSNDFIYELLNLSLKEKKIVTITIMNSNEVSNNGIVRKLDKELVEIENIDSYGLSDGFNILRIDDITYISFDDYINKDINYLYNKNL